MLIKEVVILRSRDLEPSQKAVRIRHAGRKELMLLPKLIASHSFLMLEPRVLTEMNRHCVWSVF